MLPPQTKGLEKPLPLNKNEKILNLNTAERCVFIFFILFNLSFPAYDFYIDKYDSHTTIRQGDLSKFKTPELPGKVLNPKETEKKIRLINWMKEDNMFRYIEDVDKKIRDLKRQNETIDPIILNDLNNLKMAQIKELSVENLPTIFGRRRIFILPFDSRYNPPQSTEVIKLPRKLKKQFFSSNSDSNRVNIREGDLNIFLENWLKNKENHNILLKLKIENINNLTPYQAVRLSIEIVQKELKYSHIQASPAKKTYYFMIDHSLKKESINKVPEYIKKDPKLAYNLKDEIDDRTVTDLLKNGEGVCRNYAKAAEDIFNLLKRSQDQKTSQLKNTYVRYMSTKKSILNSIIPFYQNHFRLNLIVESHAWVDVISVLPTGNIVISDIDITNEKDAGEVYEKNSTNKGLHLFLLKLFFKEKIISERQFRRVLINHYKKIINRHNG